MTFFALLTVGVLTAHGQGGTNQYITGTVLDPAGAVVLRAKATISNIATGIKTELETNVEGLYRSPALQPGEYQVQVSKTDFQTLLRTGLLLHLAEALRIDLTLQVGDLNAGVRTLDRWFNIDADAAPVGARIGPHMTMKADDGR